MAFQTAADLTVAEFSHYAQPFQRFMHMRPMAWGEWRLKMHGSPDRRRIVQTNLGVRLYLDPATPLGLEVAQTGTYEPEVAAIISSRLKPADVFLDIGANEGVFSALASTRVGPTGTVIAVEPQQRLTDLIRINLALNTPTQAHIVPYAIGEAAGTTKEFNLYPSLNTGASSFVRGPKSGAQKTAVAFASPQEILSAAGVSRVTLMKVDVEGYEHRVVEAILPLLKAGVIESALVDFHASVLRGAGVDPKPIFESIRGAGYTYVGDQPPSFSGHHLFVRAG